MVYMWTVMKNSKLKDLSIRHWDCPACGTKNIDRDINAAQNIVNRQGNVMLTHGSSQRYY